MGGEIESALTRSAGGWNTGNLDRFVAIYLDSDRTTFATASRYLHGRAAIRAYYAPRFTPGVARDSLRMENIAIDSLSPRLANVMAFYVLSHGDSIAARGPTSLLMERVRGTWYIVHDHSS